MSVFNRQQLPENEAIYIGRDAHKKTIHAAARVGTRLLDTWVMPADTEAVLASLEGVREAEHHISCEAGPTGYELARRLRQGASEIEDRWLRRTGLIKCGRTSCFFMRQVPMLS